MRHGAQRPGTQPRPQTQHLTPSRCLAQHLTPSLCLTQVLISLMRRYDLGKDGNINWAEFVMLCG